jgi:hypothetical protein
MRNKLAKSAVVLALVAGSVFAVASPASAAPTCQTLSDLGNTFFQVRCKSWNTLERYCAYGGCDLLGATVYVEGPHRSGGHRQLVGFLEQLHLRQGSLQELPHVHLRHRGLSPRRSGSPART